MRITGYNTSSVASASALERLDASPASAREAGPAALHLSAVGRLMLGAREALRGVPEVREQAVHDLGARLSSGRYRPDADAIAAAMVTD